MADLVITPANVQFVSGTVADGIAGATITAGKIVYSDATDSNKLKLADSSGSEANAEAVGIALSDALSGQPLRYQKSGVITLGTGTEGVVYVVSDGSTGLPAPVADLAASAWVTIVGVGNDSSGINMLVVPSGFEVQ